MPEISEIVNVEITVSSSALTRKGFNSLMVVGDDSNFGAGWDNYEVREYASFQAVGEDTDLQDGNVKDKAQVAFAQSPAMSRLYIARVNADGSPQVSDLVYDSDFVTDNEIRVFIDGVEIANSPIAFDTDNATTLANVASAIEAEPVIDTAVSDGSNTITITGANTGQSFTTTSTVTGGASQPTATETVTTAAKADIESSDLDAVAANNNDWFGYCQTYEETANIRNASSWVAANKKYGFFLQTVINANLNLNTNFSSVWYTDETFTGTTRHVEAAIASRILALVPGSYTAAFKRLELVGTTQLTGTQESDLRSQNVNQYSTVAGADITWDGKASAGGFIDTYIGVLYLEARIEEDVFAVLISRDKVPYTNDGINLIVNAVQTRLNSSVEEGFLTDEPPPVVNAPNIDQVSQTDKSNRVLTNVDFVAVTAGAIHQVEIRGTVIA